MSSTGTSGATSTGVLHVQNELSDFRNYMIDGAKIMERHAGKMSFLSALLHKSIPKRAVTDTVFKAYEIDNEAVVIPITACAAVGVGDFLDLTMTAAYAHQLGEGSILVNPHIQTTVAGGAGYTHYTAANYSSVTRPELVVVSSITYAGANATVRVKRMHTVYGTSHTAETNKATQIWAAADVILRMNKQRYDSQGYGLPYNKLPESHLNYIQDFTKDLGASERERNIKMFVRGDIMEDRSRSAFWSWVDEIERSMTYGSYGLDTPVADRESTLTRSFEDIIPTANRTTVTSLTMKALNDALEPASLKGRASDKRILLCSPSALSHLTILWQNHMTSEGIYGEKEGGWTLKTIMDHTGAKYQLMASYQMGLNPWLNNTFYVINMSNVQWAYFQGKERSFDMHLDKGYDGQGLQPKSSGDLIWRYRAMCGLDIGYWSSHYKIYLNV